MPAAGRPFIHPPVRSSICQSVWPPVSIYFKTIFGSWAVVVEGTATMRRGSQLFPYLSACPSKGCPGGTRICLARNLFKSSSYDHHHQHHHHNYNYHYYHYHHHHYNHRDHHRHHHCHHRHRRRNSHLKLPLKLLENQSLHILKFLFLGRVSLHIYTNEIFFFCPVHCLFLWDFFFAFIYMQSILLSVEVIPLIAFKYFFKKKFGFIMHSNFLPPSPHFSPSSYKVMTYSA